jgi:ribosomal protein L34E
MGGIKIILRDKFGHNQTFFVSMHNKTTGTRQEKCENACNIFCSLSGGRPGVCRRWGKNNLAAKRVYCNGFAAQCATGVIR